VYNAWVFVHLIGVFGFLLFHGVSVFVLFRLQRERDPKRVNDLIALSGSSTRGFYGSFVVLLVGGIVAGFVGKWWSQGWIWGALIVLLITTLAMFFMARPYYRRVGFVARAMAGGSQAVTAEQFDAILASSRPRAIAGIGFVGLLLILYLMVFKPTLGFGGTAGAPVASSTSCAPAGTSLVIRAHASLSFDRSCLAAPASSPFTITFDNQENGVVHNVAIYTNSGATTALFRGDFVTGPKSVTYRVGALSPGMYFFRCDAHPTKMTGTFIVAAPSPSPSGSASSSSSP
jgi:plastocyanin